LVEQKEISHAHYKDLTNLREVQFNLDKEIDVTSKRYSILRSEIENNEQRIASIQSLLAQKEDQFGQCLARISESQTVIQEHKYNLNKLDSELGYLEGNNEQHKAAQG
jgi:chromosome segregation ATPase